MVRAGRSGEWSAEVASGCVAPSARHRGQCGNVSEPGEPDGCDDGRPLEIGGEPGSTVVAAPIVLEHWHHAQGPDGVTTPPPGRCIDLPYRSMVARVDLEMGNPTAIRVAPASE
jgi:hypothetical protein